MSIWFPEENQQDLRLLRSGQHQTFNRKKPEAKI